jgi:hypothetical protein
MVIIVATVERRATVWVGANQTARPEVRLDWVEVAATPAWLTSSVPNKVTIVATVETVTRDTVPDTWADGAIDTATVPRIVTTVPTEDTVTKDTVPVTTAVTVPVATTIKPVAVAVKPLLAVVNDTEVKLIAPCWDTFTVPSRVTTVPTEDTVTRDTVPLTTAETERPGTTVTTAVPNRVTIVETRDRVWVCANHTPTAVDIALWDVAVAGAPPLPPTIHTGRPVTPDRPLAVVVGTIPLILIGPASLTRTVPSTVTTVDTIAIVWVATRITGHPVVNEDWVAVGFMPDILTVLDIETETEIVGLPSQTGIPVTPDKPEPVVVGTMPEMAIVWVGANHTIAPVTAAWVVVATADVAKAAFILPQTGIPVTPLSPEAVVVGVIPEIIIVTFPCWETLTVPSKVTTVPTDDTVTKETVPLTTAETDNPGTTETTAVPRRVTIVPTVDTVTKLTVPTTVAVTVPVATTISPVAVAVRPELAVVKETDVKLTAPCWETLTVPSKVTTVPTEETVTKLTVPLTTAETDAPGTAETSTVPRTVTMVETSDRVWVGANHTPRAVDIALWLVAVAVAPPPEPGLATQTGTPVTPDNPDAVVVGVIPEIETGPASLTKTVPSTVPTVETTAIVWVGASHTPPPVVNELWLV